jgi:hypothetical protein
MWTNNKRHKVSVGREKKIFPVLKVRRQCLFVLLVQGKVLGSERGKRLGNGLCYVQPTEIHQGRYCLWSEFLYWQWKGCNTVNFWCTIVRVTSGQHFDINTGRGGGAACEAASATWNLSTNLAFTLGPRKSAEKNVIELAGSRKFRKQNGSYAAVRLSNTWIISLIPL